MLSCLVQVATDPSGEAQGAVGTPLWPKHLGVLVYDMFVQGWTFVELCLALRVEKINV